ncbi:2-hydroxyacid dehydrogenase [Marinobacterium mangrovicola]|uniref:Glyoxylate/hydroxypyruvate reductase A n=1 Tax=Marinobacterium mangrovicola TaxID=1476959 RepID=A0A4V2PDQ7_9GAMM|nr:glyoxylate/hydroxypyruvate reductase A [Marinobacterium mangrovicola]TCK06116.1 glyoxylate/hydroxypyruvate reductase A [Marinobacterium mangrovicola]
MLIPLIADIDAEELELWLESLNRVLPGQQIIASEEIDAPQAQGIEFAIVANPTPAELRRFPNLKWVQSLWAGVEKMVSMPELAEIPIVRMQDPELARIMAEGVLTWTLYLHRQIPTYLRQQQQHHWKQHIYQPPSQKRVGVLGTGNLGLAAIETLLANGFKVCAWSRSPKQIDNVEHFAGSDGLDAMLPQCDILIALLPLTDATRLLMNEQRLSRLKPGASIINFARAPIFDYAALVRQLDAGHLEHAVLDVFDQEPLPGTSELWEHSAISVLPHISGPTDIASASEIVRQNVSVYLMDGNIPETVDYQRGY